MTKIKICGITNLDDASLAIQFGADELGFNFYKKSPRYLDPTSAKSIIEKLNTGVLLVGVFVNESQERILEIAEMTSLGAIQLHGDEDHKFAQALRDRTTLYLIKAGRTASELKIDNLRAYNVNAILIDGHSKEIPYGGSGTQTDLEKAKEICESVSCDIYLAGGLTLENVADAIRNARPYAVDVASGVESSPGKKDANKMKRFIDAVRSAE